MKYKLTHNSLEIRLTDLLTYERNLNDFLEFGGNIAFSPRVARSK